MKTITWISVLLLCASIQKSQAQNANVEEKKQECARVYYDLFAPNRLDVHIESLREAASEEEEPLTEDALMERASERLEAEINRVATTNRGGCFALAGYVVGEMTDTLYFDKASERAKEEVAESALDDIPARDLQSSAPQGAAAGGSAGQGEAVPSVQPLGMGGASFAAVGTESGANSIAAISLNPSMFTTSPADKLQLAKDSRLLDFSFLLPVNGIDQNSDGKIDYFGIRSRINISGPAQGDSLMNVASSMLKELVRSELQEVVAIDQLLLATDSPSAIRGCADALLFENEDGLSTEESVARACGGNIRFESELDMAQYAEFRDLLTRAREAIDAQYFGADLRVDVGDATLGAVPGASGTMLFGGFAIGRQFEQGQSGVSRMGVRARLGVRYIALDEMPETDFSLDGGVAFELVRPFNHQTVRVSGGVEFRYSDASKEMAEILQTNQIVLRLSLNIPITPANSISLNYGTPVAGDTSPALSMNLNWNLLFPEK